MRSYFLLLGNVLHTLRDTGGREKRGIGHSRKKSQRGGDETECPVKGGRQHNRKMAFTQIKKTQPEIALIQISGDCIRVRSVKDFQTNRPQH